MSRTSLQELAQAARNGDTEQKNQYLVGVAEALYTNPRHYGFRNSDEVGEAFSRYWARIAAFPVQYHNSGTSFEAYLTSSFRYIALSIRRNMAKDYDKQAVCMEEQIRDQPAFWSNTMVSEAALDNSSPLVEPGNSPSECPVVPDEKDERIHARAFRTRLIFLCIKCACLLGDDRIREVARISRIDPEILLGWVEKARSSLSQRFQRTSARRRGRDAAWVRIGVNRRRLAREFDLDKRQLLQIRIEKDHGVFTRTCQALHNSREMVPNREVAEIMGVSKSTVDSGVARILTKYRPLYDNEQG